MIIEKLNKAFEYTKSGNQYKALSEMSDALREVTELMRQAAAARDVKRNRELFELRVFISDATLHAHSVKEFVVKIMEAKQFVKRLGLK